jgi:hypothetical protein
MVIKYANLKYKALCIWLSMDETAMVIVHFMHYFTLYGLEVIRPGKKEPGNARFLYYRLLRYKFHTPLSYPYLTDNVVEQVDAIGTL